MAKEQVGITIGVNEVKLLHFEVTTRLNEIRTPIPNDGYEFQFDMQSDINEENKLFNVILSTTLYEKQGNVTKVELSKMKTLISFRIINFDEVIKKEAKRISIPDQLIIYASGITISTARGMFAICVKDMIINNALIPILDPQLFLPKKPETN
ncbi:MAG: hypothetical protein ACOVMQ_04495 [Cyclobacteriaceae bacterium]|jgi:hypothetical protein